MEHVIEIHGLTVDYGKNRALDGVCLTVERGEYLGIIGPNGGGKSTLLGAILGTVRPTAGTLRLFGGSAERGRRRIGYVPQFAALDRAFPITVGEVVATAYLGGGLHPFRFHGRREAVAAEEMLESVYRRFLEIKELERAEAFDTVSQFLERRELDPMDDADFFTFLLGLSAWSSYLKNIVQALLESRYLDEEELKKAVSKRQKEEEKAAKKAEKAEKAALKTEAKKEKSEKKAKAEKKAEDNDTAENADGKESE